MHNNVILLGKTCCLLHTLVAMANNTLCAMVILTLFCGAISQSTLNEGVSDKDEMLTTLLDTVAQFKMELKQVGLQDYFLMRLQLDNVTYACHNNIKQIVDGQTDEVLLLYR